LKIEQNISSIPKNITGNFVRLWTVLEFSVCYTRLFSVWLVRIFIYGGSLGCKKLIHSFIHGRNLPTLANRYLHDSRLYLGKDLLRSEKHCIPNWFLHIHNLTWTCVQIYILRVYISSYYNILLINFYRDNCIYFCFLKHYVISICACNPYCTFRGCKY
jgi:hypothetical protein